MLCDFQPDIAVPKVESFKRLSLLLLDVWQRQYDKRPYVDFQFRHMEFQQRMCRSFVEDEDFPIILKFLQDRKLKTLLFSSFKLTRIDFLTELLNAVRKYEAIEFRLMDLPDVFFDILRGNAMWIHIKKLSFSGTHLNNFAVEAIREYLIASKSLLYLDLSHCDVDQYNFALIADGIHKSTSLLGFNVSRIVGSGMPVDTFKISYLLASLVWQNKLQDITMTKCELSPHDIELIAEYMSSKISKLRKLNLSYNKIGPDGAEHLFRAIAASETLTHLNISFNELGSHGGSAVAKYLSSCYRLQYLSINNNGIGAEIMNAILTQMKKPLKLLRLELHGNLFNRRSGTILKRLLDSKVVLQDAIDITYTTDSSDIHYCVIPYV